MRLTRRALLAGTAGAVAATAMQACRPAAGPSTSLVVGQGADPAGLHPLLQTGLVEASVYGNLFDPLIALDTDGRVQPGLAEAWEARDDRTWAFRLRARVTFHNGEPFDSRSVRFTVEQVLDPATASPIRAQLDAIERVETPDPRTAVVVTKRPFAPLLAELTQLMMLPASHTGQGDSGVRPVGTGPFRFAEWVRDDRLVLEATAGHWRGAPAVNRLEFRPLPDTATRMAAVRAGQVHLATNVPVDQAATLEREGLRVAGRPGVQTLYVRLHARKPPLDDLRVRQAIAHAVDVDRLIATVYGGRARRVNGPYPPEVFAYDEAAPLPTHDPERARTLLRAAGVGPGTPLVLETPRGRYPKDDQVAQVIQADLAEVGLAVQISVLEWAAYLEKVQAGRGEHLFLLAGTNRTFDPHFTIVRLYTTTSAFGKAYYGNPAIDPLAVEAAATRDPDRRRALYRQILGILRADVPALLIAQLDDLYALRPQLTWHPRADSLLWLHDARVSPA